MVLVMLVQDYCLNSGQERMDSMKSWAGIEEGKAGRSVLLCDAECESVSHVLWDVLNMLVFEVPSC